MPAAMLADSKKAPGAYYVLCKRHMGHVGVKSLKQLEELDAETRAAEALADA